MEWVSQKCETHFAIKIELLTISGKSNIIVNKKGDYKSLDINEYIQTRVDDQIDWYDRKSMDAQKWYKRLQTIEIILAAFIPLLSGYATNISVAFIIGLFGAIIAIIESISKLNKYHENWIQYRTTCEMLRYQKHLFLTGSAPYNDEAETIENVFVRNIENIISSENNQWKNINSIREEANSDTATTN